jgi:hypothetical protein
LSIQDLEPKGVINLEKYDQAVAVEGTWPKTYRFNILNTNESLNIRTFFLVSASKMENEDWIDQIMQVISVCARSTLVVFGLFIGY